MPRYHFNVHDGRSLHDRDGTNLPGPVAARREAIRVAGKMLDDNAHRIGLGEDWMMEVTDDVGLVLFRLDFHVTEAPVLGGRKGHSE